MTMRTVRHIEGFFEAAGNFALPKDRARQVLGESLAIVERYTGPLALDSLVGVRLKTEADPINVGSIQLGDQPHRTFITRREFVGEATPRARGKTRLQGPSTETFVHYDPNDLGAAILTSAHEFGHSFRLGHCPNTQCLMQEDVAEVGQAQLLVNPFCDNCAEDLLLAGSRALSVQP